MLKVRLKEFNIMMGKLGYRIYIFFIVFCDIVEKNKKIKVLNDELGNLKI